MSGLRDVAKGWLTLRRRATPAQTTQPVQATQPTPTITVRVHKMPVLTVAFFKDGRRIVTSSDKTLRIWDAVSRAFVGGPFEGHSDLVTTVAVSPDDRRIASGGWDRAIIIWDVENKQMLFEPLVKHTARVTSVCFSANGKKLASGSRDKTVIIWDAETGAILSTLECCGPVYCVAFSPDGLKLAGTWRNIGVWGTDNIAELLLEIDAHDKWVQSVVWSPDGQQLVSASYDNTIKFWDSSNGTHIGQPCTGHISHISSLTISSDGYFIATASDDKTVRLWNTKSHQHIGQPLEHTASVFCVAVSRSGDLLASGDSDGNLRLWSIRNTLSAAFSMDPSYFAHRSEVKLGQKLYAEALSDANKVWKILVIVLTFVTIFIGH
ncbi:WD40-repeat-containing domain protein [Suillus bovinus]|uniref:WD40-repeat-containing domain protein n=1 Tax=Suillus bovinus TaxID=48563 RepID=UPI001B871F68|nr:WD40-repeat-containing domain protein [Suillus bovinus]KAG2149016.1 WD40-repeat-containing domain protein [Suillus bovinus]